MKILRTTPRHPVIPPLLEKLDAYLTVTDGEDHAFYDSHNGTDVIDHAVLALGDQDHPLGCGAFKPYDDTTVEIKRVFVEEAARGTAAATRIMTELETWAAELGYGRAILETGIHQKAAMRFYPRIGYTLIDNYPPYVGMPISRCYAKVLK